MLAKILQVLAKVGVAGFALSLTIFVGSSSVGSAASASWILGVFAGAGLMAAVLGSWYLDRKIQRERGLTHQDWA